MTARPQLPDRTPRAEGVRPPSTVCWWWISPGSSPVLPARKPWPILALKVIKIENPDGGDDTRSYEHADLAVKALLLSV